MKQVASLILFAFGPPIIWAAEPADAIADCRQCLVVRTHSWSSPTGTMLLYERSDDSDWHQRGWPITIVVGKSGLGCGRGLLSFSGPTKKEGDNKAPAGVFRLRLVFGYAPAQNVHLQMPYLALSESIVAVDDPHSRYYNQLIDKSKIKDPDWRSAEKMMLGDDRYKWGVFVEHNVPPKPGAGSCIFLHVWKNPIRVTTGCTAMSEKDLGEVIRWLNAGLYPLLVQLPRAQYRNLHAKWNLPFID